MCSHQSEKASKGTGFLSPRSSKITVTKEKERRKRKSEEKERRRRKKSNGCTLSFYNDFFWQKKNLLDAKGPFGDNVFIYPARYISHLLRSRANSHMKGAGMLVGNFELNR